MKSKEKISWIKDAGSLIRKNRGGNVFGYANLDPRNCDFVEIGPVAELPDGQRLFVEIDRQAIVIFNITGKLYAIADVCSHDDGPLGDGRLSGYEIVCPRHGARFDVRNGEALGLPAVVDIQAYPVQVIDGQIHIGLPRID